MLNTRTPPAERDRKLTWSTGTRIDCPVEVASYDTLNALNTGDVYGLPSVVAMRLGEAHGDWTKGATALGPDDNGFRIAVPPAELEPRHPLHDYEARYQRRLSSRKAAA